MIEHVNSLEELKAATKEGKVLVDFFATWCGPCKMIAPVLEDLDKDPSFGVKIVKVDVDEASDAAMEYRVQAIPTLLLFVDGQATKSLMGFQRKDQIIDFVK